MLYFLLSVTEKPSIWYYQSNPCWKDVPVMPRQTLKQRSDGRYRVKYKGREFYGNTQSEALEKREVFKQELARGLRANALGITFLDYSSQWLPAYKANCADKTYNDYVRIINHACQRIGALPIKEITATEIRLLFNEISAKSQSYINKYCMTINSVFAAALNDHIILSNPCHKLRRPKGHEGTHRAITEDERKLIVESVGEHDMALAAMIMLYAGLRRGEVLALDLTGMLIWPKAVSTSAMPFLSVMKTSPAPAAPKRRAECVLFRFFLNFCRHSKTPMGLSYAVKTVSR